MNTPWLDIENRHVAFMNEETCFLNEHPLANRHVAFMNEETCFLNEHPLARYRE